MSVQAWNLQSAQTAFLYEMLGHRFRVIMPGAVHFGQIVRCREVRFSDCAVLPILDCHPLDEPDEWRSYTPFDLLPL